MYNDQLVYKVVIWAFFGNSLWTEKVALIEECVSVGGGGGVVVVVVHMLNISTIFSVTKGTER